MSFPVSGFDEGAGWPGRWGSGRAVMWVAVVRVAVVLVACGWWSAAAGAQTAQGGGWTGPALSPQPREMRGGGSFAVRAAQVRVPGGDAEDEFAARELEQALGARGVNMSAGALEVTLLRAESAAAERILAEERLSFEPAMQAEGYVLLVEEHRAVIIGASAAGVFYGAQTLKQMLIAAGGETRLSTATVRDWPAMRYRGVHDDLSRGPVPTLAFQKHQMDVLAEHKVNLFSPYFEHTLQYTGDRLAAPPGGSLTRTEAAELFAYARQRHITVVPEQEAFGHLHHVLKFERYAEVAESPHGYVLAPGQTGSLPLIKGWFTQIAEDFPSPFLHIGADETFELGSGRTRADVARRGLGPVYADFLTSIHSTLMPLHKRLLFWGDIATSDPTVVPGIPKDMIAIPWVYSHKDSYDGDILPFKKAGIETWVAPGVANWSVVYPLGSTALDNISGFVEAGQRLGSTGELTALWNDDGEGLFNQDWFGVLFGAAAGWQPGRSDGADYQKSFGRTLFGDESGRVDQAQKELMAAADLIDVADSVFFMDPWSKAGQAKEAKMRKNLSAGRLHAERAIELLEEVRADAEAKDSRLREEDALAAMELGARRIDFIGLKFQLADEMAADYARARRLNLSGRHETATRELLFGISSMNGRCQDLRDGYSLLKELYRESWLRENRPYWLDNVLVRYDLQIQRWQQRGDEFNQLIDAWSDTKSLPVDGLPMARR